MLAQLAKNERPVFNVALASDTSYTKVDITVKLKSIAGEIDQGGGVVWRARDAKNYYIARYNPLEDNYRVYKVEEGRRAQLGTSDVKRSEGWHTLRVTMTGERIVCYYDRRISNRSVHYGYLPLNLFELMAPSPQRGFSSLRIKNYKNFLRIRIKPDGTLDIFPIGVPRLDKPPILIEGPISIAPA